MAIVGYGVFVQAGVALGGHSFSARDWPVFCVILPRVGKPYDVTPQDCHPDRLEWPLTSTHCAKRIQAAGTL
jgi:hypothetical protein